MAIPVVLKAEAFLKGVNEALKTPGNVISVAGQVRNQYEEIFHGGKEKYGDSIYLKDENGDAWKIRVRWRGDRKHYLKIEKYPEHDDETTFRAAVGKKHMEKPWKYKELFPEEWRVFAIYAVGENEWKNLPLGSEARDICTEILNELVHVRKLAKKPK